MAETGLVVYDSEINKIPLRKFKPKEIDIFWALIDLIKDEGEKEIFITSQRLKEIMGWTNQSGSDLVAFRKFIKDINRKLATILIEIFTDDEDIYFTLFTELSYSATKDGVTACINKRFVQFFNQVIGNVQYTRFLVENVVKLNSGYSKELFRQLMQFHTTGWRKFTIEEFRYLLSIPDSYRMRDIDKQILFKAKEELEGNEIFEWIKWDKEYKGKSVSHITFRFKMPKSRQEERAERIDMAKPDAEAEAAYLAYQNELYGKDYKIEGQSGLPNYYDKDEYLHQQRLVESKKYGFNAEVIVGETDNEFF
jgi:plasmid replication initiation protein